MSSIHLNNPSRLLKKYRRESIVLADAYTLSEAFHRRNFKLLTYPTVVISALMAVVSTIDITVSILPIKPIMLGLSLSMLILSGFSQIINPQRREHLAHIVAVEFREIHSNVTLFFESDMRTDADLRTQLRITHELMTVWRGQMPPIRSSFLQAAEKVNVVRCRSSSPSNRRLDARRSSNQRPPTPRMSPQPAREGLDLSKALNLTD